MMVEVHPDPARARCDGARSIAASTFPALIEGVSRVPEADGRALYRRASGVGESRAPGVEEGLLEGRRPRPAGDRARAGLRIEELQSKIGRLVRAPFEDDAWRNVMEIHVQV